MTGHALSDLLTDYSRVALPHCLPALTVETWVIRCRSELTHAAAQALLVTFAPVAGWASYAGAQPGLVALGPIQSWVPDDHSWLTGAEAVNAHGVSICVKPGDHGLDVIEIAADRDLLPQGEDMEVLVEPTALLAGDAWDGRLRYAVAWAERFETAGEGHVGSIAARLLGQG